MIVGKNKRNTLRDVRALRMVSGGACATQRTIRVGLPK